MSGNVTRELIASLVAGGSTAQATAAHQVTQNGYLDGIETLIGTTNTSLSTLITQTDTVESLLSSVVGAVDGVTVKVNNVANNTSSLAIDADTTHTKLDLIVTNTTGTATAAHQVTQNGYLDGIETLIGTTNTSLGTVVTNTTGLATAAHQVTQNGYLDGIEGLIGTTNSTLSTISGTLTTQGNVALATAAHQVTQNGYLDGIEGLIGTTNSTLSTMSTNISDLETLATTRNSTLSTMSTNISDLETLATTRNSTLTTISTNQTTIQHTIIDTVQNADKANFVTNPFEPILAIGERHDGVRTYHCNGYSSAVGATWQVLGVQTRATVNALANSTVQVVSSSASDTSGGVYARNVLVVGYVGTTITPRNLSLNGTTPVTSPETFSLPLLKAYVINFGTSEYNIGEITVSDGTTEITRIRAQEGTSGDCFIAVARDDRNGYFVINRFSYTTDSDNTFIQLVCNSIDTFTGSQRTSGVRVLYSAKSKAGTFNFSDYPIMEQIEFPAIVYLRAQIASGTAYVSGSIEVTAFTTV